MEKLVITLPKLAFHHGHMVVAIRDILESIPVLATMQSGLRRRYVLVQSMQPRSSAVRRNLPSRQRVPLTPLNF